MKRQEWSSGKQEQPIMSWGSDGDEVTDKTTGEVYTLRRKESDGWVVQSHSFKGIPGGSWFKFNFQEMADRFTEPYRWQPEHE